MEEVRWELKRKLGSWGKLNEFPGRMVDWDAGQVGEAYEEACRKLQEREVSA